MNSDEGQPLVTVESGPETGGPDSVFDMIIAWALRNRLFVACGVVLVAAVGFWSLNRLAVDAIPDLSENQVIVIAEWEGHSPREVEDRVTYPLVAQFLGIAGIKDVRASSMFGLGLLTLVFEESVDRYFAQERILERLESMPEVLPKGVKPQLGPDANGLGWIYQYYFEVDPLTAPRGGFSLTDLRALQDWQLRYQLGSIKGVAEVAGIGGFEREYQVEVSSLKLRHFAVSLNQVIRSVRESNLAVGGKVVEENGREFLVRGDGLLRSDNVLEQLEQVVVTEREGTPVYLKEVATIAEGGAFRRGALDVNGREAVGGIVIMRTGEDARAVTRRIEERLKAIKATLPKGISIRAFYDRSELIDRTVATLVRTLWKEILIVTLVHIIFFWHFRSICIVTLPIPIAILGSCFLMQAAGITANVMSLGGIAVAIGVLVDAGIVMAESVLRQVSERRREFGRDLTVGERHEATLTACRLVGRPLGFAMLIIIAAFVPVFGLTGAEGKLFRPLAFAKTFVMAATLAFTMTAIPVLCAWLATGKGSQEQRHWLMRLCRWIYEPILAWGLRFRKTVIVAAGILLIFTGSLAFGLPDVLVDRLSGNRLSALGDLFRGTGSEFMPRLNEGGLLLMPVFAPGVALSEVKRIMAWQDKVIRESPEVRTVAGKLGRADTATDPAPVSMIETTIQLYPEYLATNLHWGPITIPWTVKHPAWRAGMTRDKLVQELTEKLSKVAGAIPGFLQPIENRILMLNTGIRGEIGIKVLGDDENTVQAVADRIHGEIRELPGMTGLAPSRQEGQPYVEIEVDRSAIGAHGLTVAGVLAAVEAGIGGQAVTSVIEGRERVPVLVRLARSERTDIERIGEILVATPTGAHIPLKMLASVRRTTGPAVIESENGRLRAYVQMNVVGPDLGDFMGRLKSRIEKLVIPTLPEGVMLEYSGRWEDRERAARKLWKIIPVSVLVIFMLLLLAYRSGAEALHVLLAVPFALSGGFLLQFLLGTPFSVAVWVGYIALFGTAIQTAMVMVVYLDQAVREKRVERGAGFNRDDLRAAVSEGAHLRLRPKLMTVVTIIASLLPLMLTRQAGAEVMQPLAVPIIGGMVSSLFHSLLVTPAIFAWLRERELPSETRLS